MDVIYEAVVVSSERYLKSDNNNNKQVTKLVWLEGHIVTIWDIGINERIIVVVE